MNVIQAVKLYITKMTEESGPGMKVILMDKETTSIVSMVFSQSEILQKEVYLFERIDSHSKWDNLKHMKCIAFLRPTSENIALLSRELRYPKYGTLAECDEQEAVREVQEVFADFLAVDRHLFSFNIRCAQGLLAVLLSLKRRAAVRYEAASEPCARLAERVRDLLRREAVLIDNNMPLNGELPTPQLLIIDRRDDPVTPLLSQNLYSNFGEIGQTMKSLMDEFQKKAKSHEKRLKDLIGNEAVRDHDAAKLVALYALRYEKHASNALGALVDALKARGVSEALARAPLLALEVGGAHARQSDLFGLRDAGKITKRLFKHTPLLKDTLEDLIKGKLRENLYPTLGGEEISYGRRPQDIVVFIVGGATYEESLCVHQINQANPGVRVVLGGTTIHNSASYFEEIKSAMQGVHRIHTRHIRNNLYSNFGEIGQTMKSLMDEFQKKAKSHEKVESIADMKNFVEAYPLFK
ncbi:hypothetical protein MSG28_005555, partial [Choristoneura fumiferana]